MVRIFTVIIGIFFFAFFFFSREDIYAQTDICTGPYYSVATPLTDLGNNIYRRLISTNPLQYQDTTERGGLYPGGINTPPAAHASAAQQISSSIAPLSATGSPDPNGKIVLLSLGMSNTGMEFSRFVQIANADPQKDSHVAMINGAISGATADVWANPNSSAWGTLMSRFTSTTTPQQVQAVWIKLTTIQGGAFPDKALELEGYLRTIVLELKSRFPNLKIAYFSSRAMSYTYFGGLSPEPNAYETAFSVRWLLEDQINGDAALRYSGTNPPAPLLLWGPYLWINGTTPRSDGQTWPQSNLTQDCTHPSTAGVEQIANTLLTFFKTNPYAANWFLADNVTPPPTATPQPVTSTPSPTTNPSCTPGDTNCDSTINLTDLSVVLSNFGRSGMSRSQGDFDGNGTVNLSDLSTTLSNFGRTVASPTPSPTSVPQLTIQFTPDEGTFTSSVNLDLYVPQTQTYQIYYTTNGSTPSSTNGTLYNGSLTISQTTTVRAIAYADGFPTSNVYTKLYTINIANQAPTANNQIVSTNTNTPLSVTLSYTDPDGPGPYSYTVLTNPTNGALSGTGGTRTYTPNNNFTGTDTFTWRVNDGQANSNTATVSITVSSSTSSALIFDHSMVVAPENMDRIPLQYLDIARNRRVFFRHASVGFNIWDGLSCMMWNESTMGRLPGYCTGDGLPAEDFINDPVRYRIPNFAKYSIQSQWVEECHTLEPTSSCNPPWYGKARGFLDRLTNPNAYQPTQYYPQLLPTSEMDIVMFKFGNVDDQPTSSINSSANGYFVQNSSNPDVYEMSAYEAANPDKILVHWTMGMSRLQYTTSKTFNENLRNYVRANNKTLFDFSSIVSRTPDGQYCYYGRANSTTPLANEIPNMCDEYTNEINGGHLNAYGKARVTQALWAFMARLAGWNGVLQ